KNLPLSPLLFSRFCEFAANRIFYITCSASFPPFSFQPHNFPINQPSIYSLHIAGILQDTRPEENSPDSVLRAWAPFCFAFCPFFFFFFPLCSLPSRGSCDNECT